MPASKWRQTGKAWQPAYIEAKLAVQAQKHGYYGTEPDLSPQDADKVMELVEMMTTASLLETFDTESKRGKALGVSAQRIRTLKATKLYKDTLVNALQVRGLEHTASAMPTMARRAADAKDPAGVAAFDRLMRLGGIGQKNASTFTKNVTNTTVHLSVDQQLQKFVAGRKGQVIDEAPAAALPAELE